MKSDESYEDEAPFVIPDLQPISGEEEKAVEKEEGYVDFNARFLPDIYPPDTAPNQ